jgi:hypothetical protein
MQRASRKNSHTMSDTNRSDKCTQLGTEKPYVRKTLHFPDLCKSRIVGVNFRDKNLFIVSINVVFHNCDFSGADMRLMIFKESIKFLICKIDLWTDLPLLNGIPIPEFAKIQKNLGAKAEFVEAAQILPPGLAVIIFEYWVSQLVTVEIDL